MMGQAIRAALSWLSILLLFVVLMPYIPLISLALPEWFGTLARTAGGRAHPATR